MLKPEQLTNFRNKLIAERRAIEARIGARQGDIMDTVRDEEGVGDNEDEAQLVYEREDGIVSNELDVQQLHQVKKALSRLDAGTYGVSEVSGKPIPLARLEAVPSATTLVNEEPGLTLNSTKAEADRPPPPRRESLAGPAVCAAAC